jgi:hypothetical protein
MYSWSRISGGMGWIKVEKNKWISLEWNIRY